MRVVTENPGSPDDLEAMVRRALRDGVGGAEPSPAVWQGVRQQIAAPAAGRRRTMPGNRLRPAVQGLAVGLALAGLGIGASLQAPAIRTALGSLRATPVSTASCLNCSDNENDRLSTRLVWLDSRDPTAREDLPIHGALE